MTSAKSIRMLALICSLLLAAAQAGLAFAQGGESSSPAGLSMLVLFLGLGGIIGVFVIRWSQSTGEDDE